MRRIALIAAAAALGCGTNAAKTTPGPLDSFFYPTGIAVLPVPQAAPSTGHRLLVASSNADLTYASDRGGTVIAVDPEAQPVALAGGIDIKSFAGELGLAYPGACPALDQAGPGFAIVPIRGQDLVYRLDVGSTGAVSCDPAHCVIPVGNVDRGDPWAVGIACDTASSPGGATGPGAVARAYVGYLRESSSSAWLTQIDLRKSPGDDGYVQHGVFRYGQIRGMAYDASRRRLYFTRTVTSDQTSLGYVDLGNECRIDLTPSQGGCPNGSTPSRQSGSGSVAGEVPYGVELHGIALAHETVPGAPVRRIYATGRIYDPVASAAAGGRVGDFDGLLLVADLTEDAAGVLQFDLVDEIPIGYGAANVRVLPQRPGKRDVVAALASDDGVVWIYDDETGARVAIGRDPGTGAPKVGHTPVGIAVDPEVLPGTNVARVYVGSFQESFVTPIDVPLDDPAAAAIAVDGQGNPRRITGGAP